MPRTIPAAARAVEDQLIRDGLAHTDAHALVTATPARLARIQERLDGKDIGVGSHHVAAVADELRHGA